MPQPPPTTPQGVQKAIRPNRPLALGEWGKPFKGATIRGRVFRRELERHVSSDPETIPLSIALCIDAAVRWEMIAKVCQILVRNGHEDMPPDRMLDFLRAYSNAVLERNRAAAKIGIEVASPKGKIASFYDRQTQKERLAALYNQPGRDVSASDFYAQRTDHPPQDHPVADSPATEPNAADRPSEPLTPRQATDPPASSADPPPRELYGLREPRPATEGWGNIVEQNTRAAAETAPAVDAQNHPSSGRTPQSQT